MARRDGGRGATLRWCESMRSRYRFGFSATVQTTPGCGPWPRDVRDKK